MSSVTWEGVVAILGLALITIVTRGFFLYPERELPMPAWLQQGLRYAPLAALVAVVAPEIFMTQGRLISTWMDARLPAVLAATAYFYWRRDILGTIIAGTTMLLVLKLGFGW
ncbi:MAG TPA: AzlD domain-containing protein [Burkholderiaceae bacterium]|nr:AzlD domain-containing protein [Burkholderiaceae bacterium]